MLAISSTRDSNEQRNENRDKTRRDHDITMAGSYNNREVAKLPTWSDRGDCLLIGNQRIKFEL